MFKVLGAAVLSPLLQLTFDTSVALGLTYLLLPAYAYTKLRKQPGSEHDRRMLLFAFSLALGVGRYFYCLLEFEAVNTFGSLGTRLVPCRRELKRKLEQNSFVLAVTFYRTGYCHRWRRRLSFCRR